ncbi:hypothetical protein Patl1_23300 [Pistacia atlantica]|uniref:Uncharacterized protein n=1 Tax=Pistacia atlantica TaxID=434234 RepID=A0ACC1A1Z3_9ROSI|nr:hypothetical protein Patl1_23300 [Pistacia atlantica]
MPNSSPTTLTHLLFMPNSFSFIVLNHLHYPSKFPTFYSLAFTPLTSFFSTL